MLDLQLYRFHKSTILLYCFYSFLLLHLKMELFHHVHIHIYHFCHNYHNLLLVLLRHFLFHYNSLIYLVEGFLIVSLHLENCLLQQYSTILIFYLPTFLSLPPPLGTLSESTFLNCFSKKYIGSPTSTLFTEFGLCLTTSSNSPSDDSLNISFSL